MDSAPLTPGRDQYEHGRQIVRAFMELLPTREREVIRRLFGFEPHHVQTEREVARALSIPLVAVRRHHARAKAAMRNSEFIRSARTMLAQPPRLIGEDRVIARIDRGSAA